MSRKLKPSKPLIYVFCEGETEQAYTDFLKTTFSDVAVIKHPSSTGLFEDAKALFAKNPRYRNNAEDTDEIWFFYDVEEKDREKWTQWLKIINSLRKISKKHEIRVRLLMTTGCIEYWLMLHYKMYAPPIQSVANKERVLAELRTKEPTYFKGDSDSICRIAKNYRTAEDNARQVLYNLLSDGLPTLEDTDIRNQWLHTSCKTFSTVFEAIAFLEGLQGM